MKIYWEIWILYKNKVLFSRKYKVFNRIAKSISKNYYFYDELMKINEEISYINFVECRRVKIYCIDHKDNILFAMEWKRNKL